MAMGRPREFKVDKALDVALQVFWRKGYEGASMADLTEAMAITKPSLYAAFGDKHDLYLKTLRRYRDEARAKAQALLAEARALTSRIRGRRTDSEAEPAETK